MVYNFHSVLSPSRPSPLPSSVVKRGIPPGLFAGKDEDSDASLKISNFMDQSI